MADFRTTQEKLNGIELSDLESRIRACTSSSEIETLMASQNQSQRFVRQADGFTETVTVTRSNQPENGTTMQQAAPQPKPADDGQFRAIWMKPDGTLQMLEAASLSGLDTIERSFYNWKGARKIR